MLTELESLKDLDRALATHHKTIVCYSTPWAVEATNQVDQVLEDFGPKFPDISFYAVNVDAVPGVADREKVLVTPTIQGYFRGLPFGEGIGGDPSKIEDLLRELHFQPELEA